MFALEREHTPFVGSRTGVFLEPSERANPRPRLRRKAVKTDSQAGVAVKTLSKSKIVASIAEKSEISKKQASEILDYIAELAYEHAKETFTLPGIGKLVLKSVPPYEMIMHFGPKKGQTIRVPAKRIVKFRIAKAAKEAILKK
jgi:DNA-binding protein HU-beta